MASASSCKAWLEHPSPDRSPGSDTLTHVLIVRDMLQGKEMLQYLHLLCLHLTWLAELTAVRLCHWICRGL